MQRSKSFQVKLCQRRWRVRWYDVNFGKSVHSSKVLENAGSVEEIEDDVVMAEHDSDKELAAGRRASEGGTSGGYRGGGGGGQTRPIPP